MMHFRKIIADKSACRDEDGTPESPVCWRTPTDCLLGFLYVLYASENTFGDLEKYAISE